MDSPQVEVDRAKVTGLVALFGLTALSSAFLLFWVEPLFAKMALPLLGGSPAVWNTCLMYFQALLLLGYLYAHLGTRYLTLWRQVWLHVALLGIALLALPVAIPQGWTPPGSGNAAPWLVLALTVSLGLPFLILSATAPLVQRWFATLDHPAAEHPYVLYAASNAGSLLGLLAFPVLLEPNLRLSDQSRWWSVGFGGVVVLTALCGIVLSRYRNVGSARSTPAPADRMLVEDSSVVSAPSAARQESGAGHPGARDRIRWIAIAFVPSSLLLGVTTYLSTDVAAAPFLWVVPLALYLLTFVIVFARRSRNANRPVAALQAGLVAALVLVAFWDPDIDLRWAYPLHLAVFALTALVLHGELAASRPAPVHLTEYYLWIAVGGALGGVFNAIVAPLVFDTIVEYELVLVLACFLRPSTSAGKGTALDRAQAMATTLIPALLVAVTMLYGFGDRRLLGIPVSWIVSLAAIGIILALQKNAIRFGVGVAAITVAGALFADRAENSLYKGRSFFGTYIVERSEIGANLLYHGTTIHGAQFVGADRKREPLTYYHPRGPVGQMFAALDGRLRNGRVAAVGLGAGSLLCYGTPGQEWTFFEIDPLVESIARTPQYFTFLSDCPVTPRVVIGDARITLAREKDASYSLLVLDAFTSDAIPVHLLTREAFSLYTRLLDAHGVLLIHVSNRHLKLESVVGDLARTSGLTGLYADHSAAPEHEEMDLEYSCDWVVLARDIAHLGALADDVRWRPLRAGAGTRLWTDDYSNVFSVLRW